MIRAKENTAVSGLACLFDSCLSFYQLFSLDTPSLFFSHLIFFLSLYPWGSSGLNWKRGSRRRWKTGRELVHLFVFPYPLPNSSWWLIDMFGFPPVAVAQAALKGEPNRAFPILHEGIEKTSRPKSGRLASHWRTLHLSAELSLPISSPPHLLLPSSPPASPHWRSLGGYGCTYTLPFISIFLNSGFLFKWIIVQRCFNIKASVGH